MTGMQRPGREMTPQIDLRERLDLYAGPRPIKLYSEHDSPLKGYAAGEIEFTIIRENTEGLFSARGSSQPEDRSSATDTLHHAIPEVLHAELVHEVGQFHGRIGIVAKREQPL